MANVPISAFTVPANTVGIGATGYSLTGSASASFMDLAGTWNTSGTPTLIKANVTDTASNANSLLMDLQVGGASRFSVGKAGYVTSTSGFVAGVKAQIDIGQPGLSMAQESAVAWSGTGNYFNNKDLLLVRDAANTLAQRNGVNAQAFRVYSTYTDASNYERVDLVTTLGGTTTLRNVAAGTGSSRSLAFDTPTGGGALVFATGGVTRWLVASSNGGGHFIASTDNLYDIGASGATRPRIGYFGTGILSPYFQFNSEGRMASLGDGIVRFTNAALNDFNRMVFGGATSSFPALKRSSASLIVRLADDSANAALESASLKTDAPAGGTAATWKLGAVATVTPTLQNRTIEVDIGGTIYYISAKTTND